ncbi:MAG: undecaprenyldiphospho-muramoylpentapeptide beta-N-acetylglucosaminyltransferase [Actinomycetota bacterium]|nr:undecaprenyldiphospho-muramoylpentapeptide beta-N-acetylglucosaminyltransferase [Actinomycetota bacterium]
MAICGGGTGGHLHPLLALAEELASREGVELALFLSSKSPVGDLLAERKVVALELQGFSRSLETGNLRSLALLLAAFRRCRAEMKRERPDVAVSFGGYAGVPGSLAALSLGVPLVIHEQNAVPGLANRMLAPLARKVAVSFRRTLEEAPGWKKKAVLTGNPLLSRARQGGDVDPWSFFGLERGRRTVAVVGGSQGAASLNRAVLEALPAWRERGDLQVVHAVGVEKYPEFASLVDGAVAGPLIYRPYPYIQRMDLLYAAADLVVCRAGASTIAELAEAGCPAVLVPYPYATAGHQEANAGVLVSLGAAVMVPDGELDGSRLRAEVEALLADASGLARMREAARRAAVPGAAARLADLVAVAAGRRG